MTAGAHYRSGIERAVRAVAKRTLRRAVEGGPPEELPLSVWRLKRDGEGALVLDGVRLGDLLDRWGSPLHVVDAERLRENAARFTGPTGPSGQRCEVYASYKTNPVPWVLSRLHRLGLGAEVVSPYELWLALKLGVEPERIIFNGPAHDGDSLEAAIGQGVGLINVNAREQLAPLAAIARRAGRQARVGIRVVAPGCVGGQFGDAIESGAALEAFREALRYPELKVIGLHAHFNGEISRREQLTSFLGALLGFAGRLREELDLQLEVLDLGGNLANPSVTPLSARERHLAVTFGRAPTPRPLESVLSVETYRALVVTEVERYFTGQGLAVPRIALEPGRALMGEAQLLLCRVAAVRESAEGRPTEAVLDAGINVAESVKSELHPLLPLELRPGAGLRRHRLYGPSCTLADLLYPACWLPPLAPGDALAITSSGAYFVPFSTQFSFPRPGVAVVDGGTARLARRGERFEDLVSLDALDDAVTQQASPRGRATSRPQARLGAAR